jgi:hypothetical protein
MMTHTPEVYEEPRPLPPKMACRLPPVLKVSHTHSGELCIISSHRICEEHMGTILGLDHGIGHLASMSSHQRLKRVSDLVILRHDDYRARD